MAEDRFFQHPFVGEVVAAAAVRIPLGSGIDEGQIFRRTRVEEAFFRALVKASGWPEPTNPLVVTTSPSLTSCAASCAVIIFTCFMSSISYFFTFVMFIS